MPEFGVDVVQQPGDPLGLDAFDVAEVTVLEPRQQAAAARFGNEILRRLKMRLVGGAKGPGKIDFSRQVLHHFQIRQQL